MPPLGHVNKLTVLYCSVLNGMFTLLLLTLYIIEGGTNLEITDYITSNNTLLLLFVCYHLHFFSYYALVSGKPHTPVRREWGKLAETLTVLDCHFCHSVRGFWKY